MTDTATTLAEFDPELAQRVAGVLEVEVPVTAWNSSVSRDATAHFALGVGDDNPLWWDPEVGTKSRWGHPLAPPTFLSTCSNGGYRPGSEHPPSIDDILGDYSGVWIRDHWTWERPVRQGDVVSATTAIVDVTPRMSRSRGLSLLETERTTYRVTGTDEVIASNHRSFLRFSRRDEPEAADLAWEPPIYDADARQALAAQYDHELHQRRGSETRYLEDVQAGEQISPIAKGPLTVTNLVGWVAGWGSPMCQTNRIAHQFQKASPASFWTDPQSGIADTLEGAHWNDRLARATGLPAPYDFGAQRVAWFVHALTDWMGDDGHLRTIEVQLRRPNLLGDVTYISGDVVEVDEARATGRCALRAINQRGETSATAEAVVELPRRNVR